MAQQWDLTVQLKRTGEILEVHSFAAGSFCVAQPNEEFAIIFHNQASQKVSFDLSVDGKKVGSTKHTGPNKTFTTPGWRLDDHNCRAFVFSPPPTFDASQPRAAPAPSSSAHRKLASSSAAPAASADALNALGEIKAVVWPVKQRTQGAKLCSQHGKRPEHQQMAVPEDKKTMALGVTTGAGSTVSYKKSVSSEYKTDHSRGPLGTVTLRYCVPDALRLSPNPTLKAVGETLANKAAGAASSSAAAPPPRHAAVPQQPAAAPNASVRQPKREAPKFCDVGSGVENAMPAAKAVKRNEPEVIDLT